MKTLADLLAQGGEGAVYPLQDRPEVLVKCYHENVLAKRGPEIQRKVEAMVALRQKAMGVFGAQVSWPLLSVFDAQQNWIGYAMRRADGVSMHKLMHPMLATKYFPFLNRVQIIAYLLSFVDALLDLHKAGVFVGDFNPHNVLCVPNSDRVVLIDCDSYQVSLNGKLFPCPVLTADMAPVEQHGKPAEHVKRNASSETFSAAILLFKALMLGRHPFDIVGGEDPVSNMRSGRFAYGQGNKGVPIGPWYNIWSHMPYRLKHMFITTFTDGVWDKSQRPSLVQWREELRIYQTEIGKGWHNAEIRPDTPKANNQYRGSRSNASIS
ncbi:MAG: hypothetical protein PF483_13040 [Halothiobacillus sp.]|nr:hypothetical protein [Halothiobacillus sp.]